MKIHILTATVLLTLASSDAVAQSGTNSPYSRYGLGRVADQSIGMSRGMNGVGMAFREKQHVNYLNPSAYSAIDSLTFLFDVGMSLQNTNFKENGKSKNAKNGDFEYAVGGFRLLRHVGMAFGIMPYTNVGYNYSSTSDVEGYKMSPSLQESTTVTTTFSGSGGLHQIFVGAGWEPLRGVSVGMNLNYVFGNLNNSVATSYSDGYARTMTKSYGADVSSIKLDFGASYTMQLPNRNSMTLGITYTPGYKTGSDSECSIITKNEQSAVNDTTLYKAENSLAIPTQLGVGISYKHAEKWLLGFDYSLQRWSAINGVAYTGDGNTVGYTDSYNDRHHLAFGGQYCKNPSSRQFTDRLRYRFGASYTSSYLKINGKDGPDEFSLSAGLGVPIQNKYNTRSIVNVALQWSRASAKNMLTENTFLINIGITFNERWFDKWKFE